MRLDTPGDLALFNRRTKASYDAHRRRAAADRQQLGYDLADPRELVQAAERCAYCGAPPSPATFALDHATPSCGRADYSLGNVVVCCAGCNLTEGLMSLAEFRALLALTEGWHPRARQDLLARRRAGSAGDRGSSLSHRNANRRMRTRGCGCNSAQSRATCAGEGPQLSPLLSILPCHSPGPAFFVTPPSGRTYDGQGAAGFIRPRMNRARCQGGS